MISWTNTARIDWGTASVATMSGGLTVGDVRRSGARRPTWQSGVVHHRDPAADRALGDLLDALAASHSALVVPRQAYPGLERVVELVAGRSATPVLVTDLGGTSRRVDGSGSACSAVGPVLGFHTSGSTGHPKCVLYEQSTVAGHADMVAGTLRLDASASYVALPPANFAYGLSIVTSHARAGVPVTFVTAGTSSGPLAEMLAAATSPIVLYLLPQQATVAVACAELLGAVSTMVVAGGRLAGRVAAAIAAINPHIELVNMYGQAELGPRLSMWRGPLADFTEGTIGHPVPGAELRLGPADEHGRAEILARSVHAMSGVIADPYDTVRPGPAGEPVPTGDLAIAASAGASGGLVHAGRTDRFANVAGTKIDLADLTEQVQRLASPLALRIATRPARVSGDQVLVIQVVPQPGHHVTAPDLRRALRPVLGPLTAMADVHVVEHLALGEAGK